MTICIYRRKAFIVAQLSFSMKKVDFQAGIDSLRKNLKEIKTLLAWQRLKRSETRVNQPPAFRINDSTETDIKNKYSEFLYTSMQMHNLLNSKAIAESRREDIRRQIIKLERQLRQLDLPQY